MNTLSSVHCLQQKAGPKILYLAVLGAVADEALVHWLLHLPAKLSNTWPDHI